MSRRRSLAAREAEPQRIDGWIQTSCKWVNQFRKSQCWLNGA